MRDRRWSRLQEALIISRVVLFGRRGLSLSQESTALPNHNEVPWHTPRMALIKEADADKCQGGCGKTRVLYPVGGNGKWCCEKESAVPPKFNIN